MKKTIFTLFLLLLFAPRCTHQAEAQELYIGSFYVTSIAEESLYGDGKDKWATRLPVISEMFNFEQPDVLGLQSLTETQLSQLSRRLTNYNVAPDSYILYNKSLELDTCGIVDEMPEGSTCTWARLRKDGKAFYVFNICFATGTSVATASSARVRTAMGEVNTENLPSFIVGFLGVNEGKTAYTRLLSKHYDCFTRAAVVSAEYGTRNNFDLSANHGTDRFDFVLASKTVTVRSYGQLQYGYYTLEPGNTYKRRLPSTHFPVMAKVTLP